MVGGSPRVLILGTMPSPASLAAGFYYAHPRNAFWPIMAALFGFAADAPYPERAKALIRAGVAVWDVCRSCVRPGSSDGAIRDVEPNDFGWLFARFPSIRCLFFNGAAAEKLFFKLVLKDHPEYAEKRTLLRLPSTSPANAMLSVAEKTRAWQVVRIAAMGGELAGSTASV
ncbi:MAG: DNA-deoxyinosine glycosylase [Zetaproteobacteria bacterium]|nr:MAG: DNA-deoxyinosine glycosylase [Zetaproteobacteria bacterium]